MADAGQIYYEALSGVGRNLGHGIQQGMDRYNKMKAMDATVQSVMTMIPEDDPDRKSFQRAYERYQQFSGSQKAAQAEGLLKAFTVYSAIEKNKSQVLKNEYQGREAIARANAYITGNKGAGRASDKVPVQIGDQTVMVTGNEAARINQKSAESEAQTQYGLTPDQVKDSSQHAAVEPIFGADGKVPVGYKKSDTGSVINVGGQDVQDKKNPKDTMRVGGVNVPRQKLEILRRRLDMQSSGQKGKVLVVNPKGIKGYIPQENLQAALKAGYTQAQ